MPDIIRKALAEVSPVADTDDEPNGSFDVILSAQTLDRDGDTLTTDGWQLPLPDHITFDSDHGMSVETTVGSGKPFINDDGDLQVRGTYASTPHAQNVRTLVKEGHIRTTSVAFMPAPNTEKDASPKRELLNGAFVAIPSNRDAVVLSSKAFGAQGFHIDQKLGARTNEDDASMIQAIHDAAHHLGASCAGAAPAEAAADEKKSFTVVAKGLTGSVEDLRERVSCALRATTGPNEYPWIRATFLTSDTAGSIVYELNDDNLSRSFTDDGTTVTLGAEVTAVRLVTSVAPVSKSVEPTDLRTRFEDFLKSLDTTTTGSTAGQSQDSATTSATTAAPTGTAAVTDATADDVALRAKALEIQLGATALGTPSTKDHE
ncbi:hypothetical protein ACKAMS_24830 [Rhodococcus sp. 5A-K4]|uniref:hypothetical protein n=1 Tax=Rhodococcus sp. 5A-K4 TaxID=3384442 RepID=UPI0038D40A04